ncbi:MAG: hypothetical protein EP314_07275 [Bacteroidetes bacterium]|nr:MAG: hypothetical protein EP314_07275 [Bacteroidota bacterium]
MQKLLSETLNLKLIEFGGNKSIKLYYEPNSRVGLAEAIVPYMPMDDFMNAFKESTRMVEEFKLTRFIFDKRALRAFHQPSMEWYFVQWKPKVRDLGLTTHYKILPDEDWFRKCVEAGREDIRLTYGDDFLHNIDIHYVGTIQEAFSHEYKVMS